MNPNEKAPKNAIGFYCNKCLFKCFKQSDWNRHLTRRKHNNPNKILTNPNEKAPKNADKIYQCECKKKYKHMSSLCAHKKKCTFKEEEKEMDEIDEIENIKKDTNHVSNDVIIELVKQNHEFQKLIIEQNKQIIELSRNASITNNNNNTNCHNRTKFNLNFFLNEQCKDALNIMDFVNNLQVQLTDLENVGKLGYSEGISKIFINGLKQLDVFKRPIHCSDLKREILYVKDQNAWEKENDENNKIKNAINHISHKNITQIPSWIEQNPNCNNSHSNKNDEYLQIVNQSMGSVEQTNIDKIIHNIAKEVVIDK
jgi:hypothetical protein